VKGVSQALETILFMLGVVLACIPALYLATVAMHKLGLPSPAEAAGAQGQQG
jgi:hypothetical protein